MTADTEFLGSTQNIRQALLTRLEQCRELNLAVAFVTSEWLPLLKEFKGRGRLVCWLTSGATDPYAIERLMKSRPRRFKVRHMVSMHAKVYFAPPPAGFAVVGSANLSTPALAEEDHAGNVEAGVVLHEALQLKRIAAWFEALWEEADDVTPADLARARKAYDQRKRARGKKAVGPHARTPALIPPDWQPSQELRRLASQVRHMDLRREIPQLAVDPPRMNRGDVRHVIDLLTSWARRRYSFEPLLDVRIRDVRASFAEALDASMPIEQRFERLLGPRKLAGLGLPSWTMVLYYFEPEKYPPYNERTPGFIRDFRLGQPAALLTPQRYAAWLGLCSELAARLRLPSPGHVDRMVWQHSERAAVPSRR